MAQVTNIPSEPGKRFDFENQGAKAVELVLDFDDGTEVRMNLHPGAKTQITAGTNGMKVSILDAGGPQHIRSID